MRPGKEVREGDKRERKTKTQRERHRRRDRLTEIIILQGARVCLYLLETRETQRDERDRHGETQRDETDRVHYPTGCKGLAVTAGDKVDSKR